ncbi:hypothetical protein Pfo_020402, partial [Paulownia fortunei]
IKMKMMKKMNLKKKPRKQMMRITRKQMMMMKMSYNNIDYTTLDVWVPEILKNQFPVPLISYDYDFVGCDEFETNINIEQGNESSHHDEAVRGSHYDKVVKGFEHNESVEVSQHMKVLGDLNIMKMLRLVNIMMVLEEGIGEFEHNEVLRKNDTNRGTEKWFSDVEGEDKMHSPRGFDDDAPTEKQTQVPAPTAKQVPTAKKVSIAGQVLTVYENEPGLTLAGVENESAPDLLTSFNLNEDITASVNEV